MRDDVGSDDEEAGKCVGNAWCVITYGGSEWDAVINYVTLALQGGNSIDIFLVGDPFLALF